MRSPSLPIRPAPEARQPSTPRRLRRNPPPLLLAALVCAPLVSPSPASAGRTLAGVHARGVVRCGVSEGIAGFSERDGTGRWVGLDADFCRAIAASVVGDAEKVVFVPLAASTRFPALIAGEVDLLLRNTSWTMTREVRLGVRFPGVLFYDGQAFLVARDAGVTGPADLAGGTVCVEKGTTHLAHLDDWFGARGLAVTPVVVDSATAVAAAFFAGRCRAYSGDASQLAAARLRAPAGAFDTVILPERISKEPLGPVVRHDDTEWESIVRWVLFALVLAEEAGVGQSDVATLLGGNSVAARRLAAALDEPMTRALGVQRDWLVRAVAACGNYGEMYERNLGSGSELRLERGLNRLWRDGGLHFAPPLN